MPVGDKSLITTEEWDTVPSQPTSGFHTGPAIFQAVRVRKCYGLNLRGENMGSLLLRSFLLFKTIYFY